MRITPIDIVHKSFNRRVMGYDIGEVSTFLQLVSDRLSNILTEKNQLKASLREKELELTEYQKRDQLLKTTITAASRMSERLQTDAEREAKLIIQDAHQRAATIVKDARSGFDNEFRKIADLQKTRLQFENGLKALLQSHLSMLKDSRKFFPNPCISEKFIEETPVPNKIPEKDKNHSL